MVNRLQFAAITIAIFLFDRLTKLSIIANLQPLESIPVFSFFSLTLVHNYGVAWGFLQGKGIISILVSVLVILLISYNYENIFKQKNYVIVGIALILAGAVGNLVDRLVYGYVIDFLDFHFWPVFNVADSALVIGAFLFAAQKENKKDQNSSKSSRYVK